MSSFPKRALLLLVLACGAAAWAQPKTAGYAGIGRDATPKEVAAWDIDVRPDFKGLPPGSGSVTRGQDLWKASAPRATACSANRTRCSAPSSAAPRPRTSRAATSRA